MCLHSSVYLPDFKSSVCSSVLTLQWTEDYAEKSHILAFAPLEVGFWNAVYIKTFQNKTHFLTNIFVEYEMQGTIWFLVQ